MKELNKTNRLTIVVLAFVLVLIIGLITLRRPDVKYHVSPEETIALLNDSSLKITPAYMAKIVKDSAGKYVFVDVRNSIAFGKNHVKNAVNIPVRELFSSKNNALLKDISKAGQPIILYGETEQEANGVWLMLQQTGYRNVKLYTAGFEGLLLSDAALLNMPQHSEEVLVDTAALTALKTPAASGKKPGTNDKAPKKKVSTVKKEASSGGGC